MADPNSLRMDQVEVSNYARAVDTVFGEDLAVVIRGIDFSGNTLLK